MRESQMRESQGSDGAKPPPSPKPTGPSTTEVQEEIRRNFERQQALVQEQLARLAQKERETAAPKGPDELNPALLMEKGKAHEEQERAKTLVSAAFWVYGVSQLHLRANRRPSVLHSSCHHVTMSPKQGVPYTFYSIYFILTVIIIIYFSPFPRFVSVSSEAATDKDTKGAH
ncbi:coiled-coil-helix-coiled-coil-helix domain containing 6b isoform X3 [Anarrhichthys ocellatus]|nr:uncharacterized protein LOC116396821 isoform X3 [Anarrhichthys ocellatus]XP_031727869.1 uncharacterized protein LOC116396821 isoform X3 [Anarrhichthys ocellatus]